MGLIKSAKKVTNLTAGGNAKAVSPAAVQEYLARHGVAADIEPVKKSNSVAKALLDTSGRHSADLMFSGVYSDSRERETILGEMLNTSWTAQKCPQICYIKEYDKIGAYNYLLTRRE